MNNFYERAESKEMKELKMNMNAIATMIHQSNIEAGWWSDPNECIYQKLQLVSTEISEATEGERKNLMDEHLLDRKMGEVELADALIRILDLGGKFNIGYRPRRISDYIHEGASIGKMHLGVNMSVFAFANIYYKHGQHISFPGQVAESYGMVIDNILAVGNLLGYEIENAMVEKLEYNKMRADHKLENREKKHGKSF